MNVVAPFGFYGVGNIGDEATLQGFAHLLGSYPRKVRAWVASQDPRHTAKVEPAFRYYRSSGGLWARCVPHLAKAYVFPGGTPIMDGLGDWPLSEVVPIVQHAQRWSKPVIFVGTGTEPLTRPASRQLFAEALAPAVAHWSVRSMRDKERLVALGVPQDRVTSAADMGWLLPRADAGFGRDRLAHHGAGEGRLIGVNVNGEAALLKREPRLFEKLARLLDRLIGEDGARVVFLCNEVREGETFDKAAAQAVHSHMQRGSAAFVLPNDYLAPQQMMSIIASCCLTISTRYHFCLFSALQEVPFLAIKRSDKVVDLCDDLGWPFGAVPGSVDVEGLAEQGKALIAGASGAMEGLAGRVLAMRERALRNTVALDIITSRGSV